MKKTILITLVLILGFLGLVIFNYSKAQKAIKDTKPSTLGIYLLSYPENVKPGELGSFVWNVTSSANQNTTRTTIYWGYDATPSALTTTDSPEAVSYANFQNDYYQGIFRLPDTFSESIQFLKSGKVYFRAYANIDGQHLWTPEYQLTVSSNEQ